MISQFCIDPNSTRAAYSLWAHVDAAAIRAGASGRARSAGFQPAVSPTSSRQACQQVRRASAFERPRVGNPRYSRLEACATTSVSRCSRYASNAVALVLGLLFLAGCAVGPNYSRPTVSNPVNWKETIVATNAPVLPTEWWTIFQDAELNALETEAVHANQDLKRATARVTEARALARVSKADLYPNIAANGAYSRNRLSENRANTAHLDSNFDDFSTSFDLHYELDVWGRVRRNVEASKADAGAAAADLEAVLLTLTADVARDYQSLRSLDNEKKVIETTVALRQDALRLQETRYKAGLVNEMDVSRARTELANVEAELQAVTRSRAEVEHALAVLCGQPPASFSVIAKTLNVIPPQVPAGLRSDLLQRRPDIVEAERNLQAANARIGVAKAAFFPVITLTGSAGYASVDLSTIVNWPSHVAAFGPSISVPVFQGGRNRANLKAAEARYDQNVATYRNSILKAFEEVEDSLSDLETLATQSEAVNRALVSARDTSTLATERYQKGLTSYLDVVDAQRAALDAERQQTQLNGQRAVSTILLAKALGGGWQSQGAAQGRN
ncbi:MAG: RND transporter [Verrucomicrobia bacterium]|nr:MAG: RND transporter [Verrucomicrobiota bacterium]